MVSRYFKDAEKLFIKIYFLTRNCTCFIKVFGINGKILKYCYFGKKIFIQFFLLHYFLTHLLERRKYKLHLFIKCLDRKLKICQFLRLEEYKNKIKMYIN